MVIAIPAVLLLGILLFVIVKFSKVSLVLVAVAVGFGFILAGTKSGPALDHWLHSMVAYVSGSQGTNR